MGKSTGSEMRIVPFEFKKKKEFRPLNAQKEWKWEIPQ